MARSLPLSPGVWDVLKRLRPHLDLAIDVFDASLNPLLPDTGLAPAQSLRLVVQDDQGAQAPRPRFHAALRSGQHQIITAGSLRIGIFPLRHERLVLGLLAAALPLGGVDEDQAHPSALGTLDRRLERLGWSLRALIESDLTTTEQLTEEQKHALWLSGIIRLLEHLHDAESEEVLLDTLVHAVTIWSDADARIYRRTLGGRFLLSAALPSASPAPLDFAASLVDFRSGITRLTSIAELEQFGWSPSHREVVLVPITVRVQVEEVLVVLGAVSERMEGVLRAVTRTLADCLHRIGRGRIDALLTRLEEIAAADPGSPATPLALLRAVANAVQACYARLLVRTAGTGTLRELARLGGGALAALPDRADGKIDASDTRLLLPLGHGGTLGSLELTATPGRVFSFADRCLAEAAARSIAAWLPSAAGTPRMPSRSGFESRIQEEIERAKRFNLNTGLLVVGAGPDEAAPPPHAVIDAVRSELRASDLVGRLAGGELAALLVHTDPHGVAAAAGRIERRLARLVSPAPPPPRGILGRASFPSAGETAAALLDAARRDRARVASDGTAP